MVYVTKSDGSSFMHVYNAKTMDAKPIAEVSRGSCRLHQWCCCDGTYVRFSCWERGSGPVVAVRLVKFARLDEEGGMLHHGGWGIASPPQ